MTTRSSSVYHRKAFQTYAGYARAWRIAATRDDRPFFEIWDDDTHTFEAPLIVEQAQGVIGELEPGPISPHHPVYAFKSLSRAWATEQLMHSTVLLASKSWSGGLLRAAAPWITVQAYYACFSSTQALIHVIDGRDLERHADVRAAFSRIWDPSVCPVRPFCWSVIASPAADAKACTFIGVPDGVDARQTDPKAHWSRFEAWNVVATSLRTTLERQLEDRRAKRREKLGVARLSKSESTRLREKERPVTMLDVLHRLRVATNYEDADIFTLGPKATEDDEVRQFVSNLAHATTALLMATELRIASMTEPGTMENLANDWLNGGYSEGSPFAPYRKGSPLYFRREILSWVSGLE